MTDNSVLKLGEFDLIKRFFKRPTKKAVLGIGDDCALLEMEPNLQWAISTDMLVSGRHFFEDVDPYTLGHKTLAVNLSDLAAMGARPRYFTLALALPEANPNWLKPFSEGLLHLAELHHIELIGGDTTKGPLNLSVTVMGDIPPNQALRRDAAHIGDDLWVSGVLGDARLALGHFLKEWVLDPADFNCVRRHLEMPIPRVHLGLSLRGIARAALDISDGLVGDLKHILDASKCGAILHVDELPLSTILNRQPIDIQRQCALYGGDDYELCFSASPEHRERIKEIGQDLNIRLTQVGYCVAEKGLHLYDKNGQPVDILGNGFDHFLT